MLRRTALLLLVGITLNAALAESGEESEYPVKAAMVYNFSRFIEWPPTTWSSPRDPMVIGVLGSSPVGRVLEETLRGKTSGGRELRVVFLRSADEIGKCQILFVANSEKKRVPEILKAANAGSVLTVSDIDHFVKTGGMIGFFFEENHLRFEIAPEAASRAGLAVSSKLLSLATVKGGH
jgi:hypothetical protein